MAKKSECKVHGSRFTPTSSSNDLCIRSFPTPRSPDRWRHGSPFADGPGPHHPGAKEIIRRFHGLQNRFKRDEFLALKSSLISLFKSAASAVKIRLAVIPPAAEGRGPSSLPILEDAGPPLPLGGSAPILAGAGTANPARRGSCPAVVAGTGTPSGGVVSPRPARRGSCPAIMAAPAAAVNYFFRRFFQLFPVSITLARRLQSLLIGAGCPGDGRTADE